MLDAPRGALVLGGTGHVGNAIVRELLARGYRVTAARRGRSDQRNLAEVPVVHVHGDADDPVVLQAWVQGHDIVVDAAAPYPLAITDRGCSPSDAARRATAIVEAARRNRARLVHIGSFVTQLGVDSAGSPRGLRAQIESRLHPYFEVKRAGDIVFLEAGRAGLPVAIIHPTTCLGPWDGRPRSMAFLPRLLAGEVPAVPSHVINVVDVRDVARCAVAALEQERYAQPILTTGHNIGLPDLCALVADLAGTPLRVPVIPAGVARAAAWTAELTLAATGASTPPALLPTLLALRQVPVPVGPVQRDLGAAPRPLSHTVRDAIAWYRQLGPC